MRNLKSVKNRGYKKQIRTEEDDVRVNFLQDKFLIVGGVQIF